MVVGEVILIVASMMLRYRRCNAVAMRSGVLPSDIPKFQFTVWNVVGSTTVFHAIIHLVFGESSDMERGEYGKLRCQTPLLRSTVS